LTHFNDVIHDVTWYYPDRDQMYFKILIIVRQITMIYINSVEIKKNNCMRINIASFYIFLHDRKNISFIHFIHVVKLIWSPDSWIFRSVIMSYVLAINMKIPKWWDNNISNYLLSIIAQYPRTLKINKKFNTRDIHSA